MGLETTSKKVVVVTSISFSLSDGQEAMSPTKPGYSLFKKVNTKKFDTIADLEPTDKIINIYSPGRFKSRRYEDYILAKQQEFQKEFEVVKKNEHSMSEFKHGTGPKFLELLNDLFKVNSEKSGLLFNLDKISQVMEAGLYDYSKDGTRNIKKTTTLGDYDIFKDRKDGGKFLELFFAELQRAIKQVKSKAEMESFYSSTLRKMEDSLLKSLNFFKTEARDYQRLCRVVDRQLDEMESKMKEDDKHRVRMFRKQEELNIDLNAENEFYKMILNRKNEIKNVNSEQLRDTVHEYSNIQKELNKRKAELKEDHIRVETLEKELSQKQQAKLESHQLYEALDTFDKMAIVFLYGRPDEFDLELLNSEQSIVPIKSQTSSSNKNFMRQDSVHSSGSVNNYTRVSSPSNSKNMTLSTVVNKFKNFITLQQKAIATPINKQAAVRRIHKFFTDHNNDIHKLFEELAQYFHKQSMKEKSLTTRIEDLYEQKKKSFEELDDLEKYLKVLMKDMPKKAKSVPPQNEDTNLNLLIEEEMDRLLLKNPDTTVVELKLNYNEVGKKIEDDEEAILESSCWNCYLWFNEILFRFTSMIKTICEIQNNVFNNNLFIISSRIYDYTKTFKNKFIFEATGDALADSELPSKRSVMHNSEEDSDMSSDFNIFDEINERKNAAVAGLGLSSRFVIIYNIFVKVFNSPEYKEVGKQISKIIGGDFLLRYFLNDSSYKSFFSEMNKRFQSKTILRHEKKSEVLQDFISSHILILKDEAKTNFLRSFRELTENWIEFFKVFDTNFEHVRRIIEFDDDDLLIPKNFFRETVRPLSNIKDIGAGNELLNKIGKRQIEKINSYLGVSIGADDANANDSMKNDHNKKKVGFSLQYIMNIIKGYEKDGEQKKGGAKSVVGEKKAQEIKKKKTLPIVEGENHNFEGLNDEERFFENERLKYKTDMKTAERAVPVQAPKEIKKPPNTPSNINPKQESDEKEVLNVGSIDGDAEKSGESEVTGSEMQSQAAIIEPEERTLGYLQNIKMLKVNEEQWNECVHFQKKYSDMMQNLRKEKRDKIISDIRNEVKNYSGANHNRSSSPIVLSRNIFYIKQQHANTDRVEIKEAASPTVLVKKKENSPFKKSIKIFTKDMLTPESKHSNSISSPLLYLTKRVSNIPVSLMKNRKKLVKNTNNSEEQPVTLEEETKFYEEIDVTGLKLKEEKEKRKTLEKQMAMYNKGPLRTAIITIENGPFRKRRSLSPTALIEESEISSTIEQQPSNNTLKKLPSPYLETNLIQKKMVKGRPPNNNKNDSMNNEPSTGQENNNNSLLKDYSRLPSSRKAEGDSMIIEQDFKQKPTCKDISFRLKKIYGREKKGSSSPRKILEKARKDVGMSPSPESNTTMIEMRNEAETYEKIGSPYNLTFQFPALSSNTIKAQHVPVGLFSNQNTSSNF